MIVTSAERRNVLKLFNVSEVARQLGVGVFELHRDIRAGRVQSPQVRIANRSYFTAADVMDLATQYEKTADDEQEKTSVT